MRVVPADQNVARPVDGAPLAVPNAVPCATAGCEDHQGQRAENYCCPLRHLLTVLGGGLEPASPLACASACSHLNLGRRLSLREAGLSRRLSRSRARAAGARPGG